jgi:glycogen(starch) synthase
VPLRIVLSPSAYYPHVGGIEELTRQLAVTLKSRGHEVSVLTNRWPEGVLHSEVLDGVSVTRLLFPLPRARPQAAARFVLSAPRAVLALTTHIRRHRPDVVHVIGAGPQSAYLGVLAPLMRVRLIFTAQGELTFDAQGIFRHSISLRAGLRQMLRNADAVTACSAYALRDLRAFESPRGPSQVVPNGVDPVEFTTSAAATAQESGPYILAVGRLVPQKGFDVLLDAFADARLSQLELLLAGDGPERAALERRSERLGVTSRVRFLGSVDRAQLVALLRGAKLFAFPSRGEAFGIALLEAMAAGVPSVATSAGGIPEFSRNGENALIVEPDDPVALAGAIHRLATDHSLRSKLEAAGRRTARDLSWQAIAERYEDVYASAGADRATAIARI